MAQRHQKLGLNKLNWVVLVGVITSAILIALAIVILSQMLSIPTEHSTRLWSVFADTRIWETVSFTFYQAGLSTIISIGVGLALAWSLANQPVFPFRNALIALISSAIALPSLVVVLGVITVYGRNGWLAGLFGVPASGFSIYGLSGILLAHVFFNGSFAARILLHRLEVIPVEKHKLGFSLGLSAWRKFRLIELPACAATLPGLAVTIFLLCFTSFAIVLTLGGSPKYNTLEVAIYEAIKFDFDLVRAFQLAMVQILICAVLTVFASARLSDQGLSAIYRNNRQLVHLSSLPLMWVQKLIIALFAVFFLAPLLAIVIDGVGPQLISVLSSAGFIRAFFTSMLIAISSTLCALILAISLASAIVSLTAPTRNDGGVITRVAARILSASAMVYLVFPALVMGLGAFLLFQKIGGNADIWAAIVVTLSNTLIALPFLLAHLRPAISSNARKHDRLCHSLAMSGRLRLKLIDWPMLKNDIAYAGALAFCFSLGDLGVIALFGSDSFKTLPWLLYQNFGSYRTQDASAIALIILSLVFAAFFVSHFASRKVARV